MLVLGTANRKKGLELAGLFRPVGVELRTLADFAKVEPVVEDGATFAANARLKAAGYARQLGRWVLADDSGLLVDALNGEPGVLSARYAESPGKRGLAPSPTEVAAEGQVPARCLSPFSGDTTDESNNRLLLERLADTPLERRTTRFVCHIAVSDPSGEIRAESEAACRGRILFEPRGVGGFGYDPLFEIVEYHRSFAEFGLLVKSYLSHRARAAGRLIPQMTALVDSGEI
jgi:XTP/dITP diphosphohydrolase